MASELKVNTLKDASGNNSVGMSYVAEVQQKRGCDILPTLERPQTIALTSHP